MAVEDENELYTIQEASQVLTDMFKNCLCEHIRETIPGKHVKSHKYCLEFKTFNRIVHQSKY